MWALIPLVIGIGCLGVVALQWRARREVSRVSDAIGRVEQVPIAAAGDATCAIRGRAVGEHVVDPVTGERVAWWDVHIWRTEDRERPTVHHASSGDVLYVEDATGRARVLPASVDLRVDGASVTHHGLPEPLARYAEAQGVDVPAVASDLLLIARHQVIPVDTELLLLGHFNRDEAHRELSSEGYRAGTRDVPTLVEGGGLIPIVTPQTLDELKYGEAADVRRHDSITRVIGVVAGISLLVGAVGLALH